MEKFSRPGFIPYSNLKPTNNTRNHRVAPRYARVGLCASNDDMGLPIVHNGRVFIPVAEVGQPKDSASVIAAIMENHERGGILAFRVSPANREALGGAIDSVEPSGVWVTTPSVAAGWWLRRREARVRVEALGEGLWLVTVSGPGGIQVTFGGHRIAGSRSFVVGAPARPTILYGLASPASMVDRLRDAGYLCECEESPQSATHAVKLDSLSPPIGSRDELLRHNQTSRRPLVRIEPWPAGHQSCVVVASSSLGCLDIADSEGDV